MRPRAAISWSGGKDSYLALHRTQAAYDVVAMVTMFSEDGARSRSHGLRPEILAAQAGRLGIPLFAGRCSAPVTVERGEQVARSGCFALDLQLSEPEHAQRL